MDQAVETKQDAPALEQTGAKKPYQAPALTRWGSLKDLTMAVGPVGAPDWGYRTKFRYTGRGGLHVAGTPKH
ncbi:hypothetical protein SAMN02745126_05322 [Enhydrobacter aerosaccus]|uniref:Lasso RiPP family leader peptide-containing protein n=1 Tax=Enhydrobacter aerosaccus TaxID=225324 RepID=A0A1T4SYT8_9HYPH|nr:lasso RiPP family leader peptide-containing protein [Enhydrobacter aerosaccus]SKA33357.1 hypothetical protein SAMN02745126_05322 [Enhydrobacter aerosaccus]